MKPAAKPAVKLAVKPAVKLAVKLVPRLFVLGALIAAPLSTACSHADDSNAASSDDALTSTMGVGTYVIGDAPFDAFAP